MGMGMFIITSYGGKVEKKRREEKKKRWREEGRKINKKVPRGAR